MPELLTAEIANEYRILAENLPENGRQDTGERRELRQELQRRCGLSELQAINILNGFHVKDYIAIKERSMQRMSEEKQKEIKTLKEWEESEKNWDDFCKPGDLVDEDVYWYFLNILPPRNMRAGYLQVGEPYDSRLNQKTGKYMATYSTFVRAGDKAWKYCGNCFPGESIDIESEDKR